MEMASENQVTIVGNLTDDPELRYTPNGAAVVKFRVAVNRRYKDESGNWKDGETSYFSVNAWRSLAENSAETLTRGTRVVVTGRLQMRSWETQEGDKRTVVEIEADESVVSGALDRITRVVGEAGGQVGNVDRWGRRRLAFEIERQAEGYYVVVEFTADPGILTDLERTLRLADEVLRFKIVVRGEAA